MSVLIAIYNCPSQACTDVPVDHSWDPTESEPSKRRGGRAEGEGDSEMHGQLAPKYVHTCKNVGASCYQGDDGGGVGRYSLQNDHDVVVIFPDVWARQESLEGWRAVRLEPEHEYERAY